MASIASGAFQDCTSLASVHISDLFAWCNISFSGAWSNPLQYAHHLYLNGEEIKDLVIPTSVTSIGKLAFCGCSGITSVFIPNSVIQIGADAFSDCSSLNSVTIPNSVTDIGNYAFAGCSSLTNITIPTSVTSIGNGAFVSCSALTSVTIPNSLTTISNYAFGWCTGLTSITIPNSVTSIGEGAFTGCIDVTSIVIGNSVNSIGSSAFANCQELTDVFCHAETVPSTNSEAFDGSYVEHATLHVPGVVYESYRTTIPWSSFGTIIVIPEKCATPTITFANGKVRFACETEDVEFVPTVTCTPNQLQNGNELAIGGTFTVSVYAVKEGYDNSDTATMAINVSQMGDLNGDGQVSIADVTSLVNIILGK